MTVSVHVLGDSVPSGDRTTAAGWPRRLPTLVPGVDAVTVVGGMGRSLATLTDDRDGLLAVSGRERGVDETVVLVHAGHNDAQVSGGTPRVDEAAFRSAASTLDAFLTDHTGVDRHAFVGLVPLLRLESSTGVPFDECQPGRSLAYDDLLAAAVGTHLPVARPVDAWTDRTEDGVHPNDAGHAFLAERVAEWLERGG